MLSMYAQCTSQFKIGSQLRYFFVKDRIAPEENRFNSQNTRKCNFIGEKKDKQKSRKSLFESLSKNTWKYMRLKYLDQLRKDKISIAVSARSRSHSLIDNCSLFIRYKEYKSQATSYKYGLCSHSLQQSRRQYSFFSRSAKPADGLKQLHINFA